MLIVDFGYRQIIHFNYYLMTYQPHDLSNLSLAGKYLSQLSTDDVSNRYYAGEKYISTFLSRVQIFLATESKLSELSKFYPYQPLVTETCSLYHERKERNQEKSLGLSAVSVFTVYQLARRNIVIPALSKFGRFLSTHRLLRQYVLLSILPFAFGWAENNLYFLNQTEKLWTVHAERLNNKILTDPLGSQYPTDILPISQVGQWYTPFIHKYDRPRKLLNETHIGLAPDYSQIEQWEKVQISSDQDGASGEEAAQEGGEEAAAEEQ